MDDYSASLSWRYVGSSKAVGDEEYPQDTSMPAAAWATKADFRYKKSLIEIRFFGTVKRKRVHIRLTGRVISSAMWLKCNIRFALTKGPLAGFFLPKSN